jgi:hypothetical protein
MSMRSLLTVLLLLLSSSASLAQVSPAEGNWACIANIDGTKAGILTIFSGSYGYASASFGSKASGTGNVQLATDGATILDGNLISNAGINIALLSFDERGRDVLTLFTPEKPVLTCKPR